MAAAVLAAWLVACAQAATWKTGRVGRWNDKDNWEDGVVPGSGDAVAISSGSVHLTTDPTVASLAVTGTGSVVLGDGECPEGWAPTGRGDCPEKFRGAQSTGHTACPSGCAKAFSTPLNWEDAESVCRGEGRGGVWHVNSSVAGGNRSTGCVMHDGERVCKVEMADGKWSSNGTWRGRVEFIGPGFATFFQRTAPAVQRCKSQSKRCSHGRASGVDAGTRARVPTSAASEGIWR